MGADTLEIVRAAVSACAREADDAARPVATRRITAFCAPYQVVSETVQDHLERLCESKELMRLPGGYWLPGLTRTLRIGSVLTILSIQPTEALQACVPVTKTFGALRELQAQPCDLREEPFEAWLDAPASTKEWTQQYLKQADPRKEAFVGESDGELLAVDSRSARENPWRRIDLPEEVPEDLWTLVRLGQKPVHYALVKRQGHHAWTAHCEPVDARRLAYGLAGLACITRSATYSRNDQILYVAGPKLPQQESSLLSSIGHPIPDVWQRYRVHQQFLESISLVFERLGIQTSTR